MNIKNFKDFINEEHIPAPPANLRKDLDASSEENCKTCGSNSFKLQNFGDKKCRYCGTIIPYKSEPKSKSKDEDEDDYLGGDDYF